MNVLQKKMHSLLVEFDEICRRHSIDYCVCSGCALGLERNGGFLPWDDDIDLFITRDNFIKLDEVMKDELPANRAWVTDKNYPEYENPLVRYVDLTTTQIVRSRIDDGSPLGLYLELFIADPYPNDPKEQEKYNKYLWLFAELKATRYTVANSNGYKDRYDEDLYHEYETRIRQEGKQKILEEIQQNFLTFDYDECDSLCVRWPLAVVILKKEWMENLVYRNFEGAMLPFMKDNIDYLFLCEYGYDWNIVPRIDNRKTHDTIVRTDMSFTMELDSLLQISEDNDYVDKIKKNKEDRIARKFLDMDIQEVVAVQKKAYLEVLADKISEENLIRSYENISNLTRLFTPYLKVQTNKRYYITKTRAEIGDEVLKSMLYLMLFTNKMVEVLPVLEIYKDRECVREYKVLADTIYRMKLEKYKENKPAVRRCCDYLREHGFDKNIEYERTVIWLMTRMDSESTEDEVLAAYSNLANKKDKEICKYVGDYYYKLKDIVEADEWYSKVKGSRNGMIQYDILKKGFYY